MRTLVTATVQYEVAVPGISTEDQVKADAQIEIYNGLNYVGLEPTVSEIHVEFLDEEFLDEE